MKDVIFRGQFAFSIRNNIVTVWEGTKHVPFAEWDYIGSFHKMFIDKIIAGLTALKSIPE